MFRRFRRCLDGLAKPRSHVGVPCQSQASHCGASVTNLRAEPLSNLGGLVRRTPVDLQPGVLREGSRSRPVTTSASTEVWRAVMLHSRQTRGGVLEAIVRLAFQVDEWKLVIYAFAARICQCRQGTYGTSFAMVSS